MNNLILIITIFGFWLYTYLTNIAQEQKEQEQKDNFNIADDDFQFTKAKTQKTYKSNITSPVSAKGE